LSVINDVLDFSKIEAGRIDLEMVDFNLRDCLEITLKTLALRADEKGLELLCEVAPEVPEVVQGDSNRLRQIVTNLVGNAIKFTHRGEVALSAGIEAQEGNGCLLRLTVSDTGIGIPVEKQKMIFDPFSQADTSTTRKYGGTGLGLTISARLAAMMGGRIWLESEVGRGTQFHFTVLFQGSEEKAEIEGITPPEIPQGLKVLVVDDNSTSLRILAGMLDRWGMKSRQVESGEEALVELTAARSAGKPYALVLADSRMPVMDGFKLVEGIHQRPELSAATIMMLSSAGHRAGVERGKMLGVAASLLKPIRRAQLRETIGRVLGLPGQKGAVSPGAGCSLPDTPAATGFLRVLVAEDNPVNQRVVTRLLEKRGHSVAVAANGLQVLNAMEKESYDVVLMDVQMPEMDGIEATRAIREKEKLSGKHQTVIALTAHAMKGDENRCRAVGMDGYLTKPIQPRELYDLLDGLFQPGIEKSGGSRRDQPGH
jgi:two-component system sensor histidine kinase/response regulator